METGLGWLKRYIVMFQLVLTCVFFGSIVFYVTRLLLEYFALWIYYQQNDGRTDTTFSNSGSIQKTERGQIHLSSVMVLRSP